MTLEISHSPNKQASQELAQQMPTIKVEFAEQIKSVLPKIQELIKLYISKATVEENGLVLCQGQ